MREDTTFSDKKLSSEEFSKKYWMGGKAPYQYHTGTIEDGRDEREQFLFNNVRALRELMSEGTRNKADEDCKRRLRIKAIEKKVSKLRTIYIGTLIAVILLIKADKKRKKER